jgi:SWI/SNF-related matrix-associated actin-dependent regulator 1 of chromatin subfamily A
MTTIKVTKEGTRWIARFPFDWATKDVVKKAGFRWSATLKYWYTEDALVAARLDPATAAQAVADANHAIAQSRAVTGSDTTIPAPEGLAYLPYQVAGINYARARKAVLIADEMGLGKTIQAIGVINADPAIRNVLVVCTATIKITWARELSKWLVVPHTIARATSAAFPSADIVIINYDILLKHRHAIDSRHWDLLIVDEAHYVKNPKAQRTKALFGHGERSNPAKGDPGIQADRVILMTGTPIINRPSELWTTVHALDPHDLGRSFFGFMKRYTNAHHNGYGWDFTGAANIPELQTRMRAKFMVRRLKGDVLTELPPKRRQVIELDPNGASAIVAAEREAFERSEKAITTARKARELAEARGDRDAYEAAVRQLRDAQSIAFEEMARLRHDTAVAKVPQVIAHLTDALEEGNKIVVFVHHHDVAHALKEAFPNAALVTGEVAVDKRTLEVDRFQNDDNCQLFIGSIKAAGVGITLTAAAHVVFAELDWVPGNISQAEDRCHRIGQLNSVLVQHLVFDNSIDARMAHMIVDKQAVIDAALDHETKPIAAPVAPAPVAPIAPPSNAIPFDAEVPF